MLQKACAQSHGKSWIEVVIVDEEGNTHKYLVNKNEIVSLEFIIHEPSEERHEVGTTYIEFTLGPNLMTRYFKGGIEDIETLDRLYQQLTWMIKDHVGV